MVAAKELGIDLLNVETPVNNGLNLLSNVAPRSVPGTVVNPGKHMTFAEITKGVSKLVSKRFTLDWYKLYFESCATYRSAFVRTLLHDVCEVKTVLQGNCNAGVSTSNEKGYGNR